MKTYLIKVDMKDVWEFADDATGAADVSRELKARYPNHDVGVYRQVLVVDMAEKTV